MSILLRKSMKDSLVKQGKLTSDSKTLTASRILLVSLSSSNLWSNSEAAARNRMAVTESNT